MGKLGEEKGTLGKNKKNVYLLYGKSLVLLIGFCNEAEVVIPVIDTVWPLFSAITAAKKTYEVHQAESYLWNTFRKDIKCSEHRR